MGYYLKTQLTNGLERMAAFQPARPKTHTPAIFLQERGLRFYAPEVGRWMSRDPIGEKGGNNYYEFSGNCPVVTVDPFGLWNYDVHYGWTRAWGVNEGIRTEGSIAIAIADDGVDYGNLSFIPITGDQSYHFNRNKTGNDSRLDHYDHHLAVAKASCLKGLSDDGDKAAIEMGKALHPLQDWVSHGDYGRNQWPYITVTHNMQSKQTTYGKAEDYPDRFDLDAQGGVEGRPDRTAIVYIVVTSPSNGQYLWTDEYAIYAPGSLRKKKTENLTRNAQSDFLNYIRRNAKPCGRCRELFLKDNDPRRWR